MTGHRQAHIRTQYQIERVNGGNLDKSLLGMEFLNRFGRLEITRDQLIITK